MIIRRILFLFCNNNNNNNNKKNKKKGTMGETAYQHALRELKVGYNCIPHYFYNMSIILYVIVFQIQFKV